MPPPPGMQRLVRWADAFAAASAEEAFDTRSSGASSLGGPGGGTGSLIKAHGRSADAEAMVHAAAAARTLSAAGGAAAPPPPSRTPLPGAIIRLHSGAAAGAADAAAKLPLAAVAWSPRRPLQPAQQLQTAALQPQLLAQERTPQRGQREAPVYTPASPRADPAARELLFP